jgi:hypothetical protein
MNLRDELSRLAHELSEERDAACDLWTWLPSYKEAETEHGDYAMNEFPGVAAVLREAAEVMAERKKT